MCGLIGGTIDVRPFLATVAHRGPDAAAAVRHGNWWLGHTRLAIQDLTSASEQPRMIGDVCVTYNGETWDTPAVRSAAEAFGPLLTASGDAEPVAVLIASTGVDVLRSLRGMFAIAWSDGDNLHLARDAFGEVPLHYGYRPCGAFLYASEVAPLLAAGVAANTIRWVAPGTAVTVTAAGALSVEQWAAPLDLTPVADDLDVAAKTIRAGLTAGTVGRLTSDAPLAILASGGLDSSAIVALAAETKLPFVAYTAVHDQRSADLRFARIMCETAGIPLVEVPVAAPTADDLADVVRVIEMPHKAQIEIAWACVALGAAMHADGIRVVISGEGADELFGSYGMSYHGIRQHGWHPFRAATFTGQHRKNFARTNKVFMRSGIEARLPFLEPDVCRYVLRLPQDVATAPRAPKAALAAAVADVVPAVICRRAKAAFQTAAKLDTAAASAVASPTSYYRAEFTRHFKGVTP